MNLSDLNRKLHKLIQYIFNLEIESLIQEDGRRSLLEKRSWSRVIHKLNNIYLGLLISIHVEFLGTNPNLKFLPSARSKIAYTFLNQKSP